MEKKKKMNEKGFYLAESIIAIAIMTIGILAAVSLLSSTMKVAQDDRDHTSAVLLAQEGIELVRNVRDNNWTGGFGAFDNNFPTSSNDNCRIDEDSSSLDCGSSSFGLYLNSRNYFVHSSSGSTSTKFNRRISVQYNGTDSITLTSMVVWGGTSFPSVASCTAVNKCVYATVILTKWGD
jgi:type II secretory pathway pseudopilin PulG